MALYKQTIPQLLKMYTNLEGWLGKAEAFCKEQDIEATVLLQQRLYPNMYAFDRQVLRALGNGNQVGSKLADKAGPSLPDEASSLEELRNNIAASKSFLESVTEASLEGAEDKLATVNGVPGMVIRGEDIVNDLLIPNVYFHLTTAYGILRQMGVDVGKADFIGPMALKPAA